jgi:outer membrane protein TolC
MFQNKFYLVLVIAFSNMFIINAQSSKITIEQAVGLALKSNYDIVISKNESQKSKNNNTLGNTGMLPKVDFVASGNIANNATRQEFSNGLIVDKTGVKSQNINTGAYLTWTIFDGFKMFATHQQLQELEKMGDLNAKIKIENTIVNIISAYYSIVVQKQLIIGLKENIFVSEERLKISEKKFEIGSSSKVEVLQAKVDLNALNSLLMRQKTLLLDAKYLLNQLLKQPIEQEIDVTDSIPLMNQYKYEDLKNLILSTNSDLLVAQKKIEVSKYMIKEVKSIAYPKLNLNDNYLFSRAENQAGFSLLNQNLGLNLGLTASWNLFNGLNNVNNIKNAKLDLENNNYEYENLKSLVQLGLIKAFKKYQDDISILKLEEENKLIAKENSDLALERFRLGVSTFIELKVAQQSFQEAIVRLSDAYYNAKISETQLLKLSGGLIK